MKILIFGRASDSRSLLAEKLSEEVANNYPIEFITNTTYDDARERSVIASNRSIVSISELECATQIERSEFDADIAIWVDNGTAEDFVEPTKNEYDFRIAETEDMLKWSKTLADLIWILE
jgi:protein-tyrosine-phosphatase